MYVFVLSGRIRRRKDVQISDCPNGGITLSQASPFRNPNPFVDKPANLCVKAGVCLLFSPDVDPQRGCSPPKSQSLPVCLCQLSCQHHPNGIDLGARDIASCI